MRPDSLYASPNALAPDYSRFGVSDRLLLTGHSHQAWPDRGYDGQTRAWLDAALYVDDKWEPAFAQADRVVALDIYRSREAKDPGITTAAVIERMAHPDVVYIPDRRAAADYVLERLRPDDVALTLGAGDGDAIGRWLLEGLLLQHASKR